MNILANLSRVVIKQKKELLEILISFETNNKYEICDSNGQPILLAYEDSGCCSRQCCRKRRPFVINIFDLSGVQHVRVTRDYTCDFVQCCSCCRLCQDSVRVECPPGVPAGSSVQDSSCCNICFNVRDAFNEQLMFLRGPSYCLCTCPGTVHSFSILTPDKLSEIGRLNKLWAGTVAEILTDADNFELLFPPNMPVQQKAVLLGAALLIDFMFFEDNSGKTKAKHFF